MGKISRRTLLAGTMLAAGGAVLTKPAAARAPRSGTQAAGLYRYRIGEFELTAIYDGIWDRPIDETFVRNVPFDDVQKALADSFLPPDKLPTPFTALLVNTGGKLVLLDTGSAGQITASAGTLLANLGAAGIDPKAIDVIAISHFHPDHINGIKTKDDAIVFPNAEILVPAPEWDFWMDEAKLGSAREAVKNNFLNVRRIFGTIAKDVRRFEPGTGIAPGVTSIPAPGHTPGHSAFAVASGSDSMLVLSDTSFHPALFVKNPEWQCGFDMDGGMAVETRKKLLDRAAADRMLVQAYHFPFPACGHIRRERNGYDFVPALWQPAL
jgi:glyoxylase-like metal-dependent hydrolase (beta-lactamase superfamily II)